MLANKLLRRGWPCAYFGLMGVLATAVNDANWRGPAAIRILTGGVAGVVLGFAVAFVITVIVLSLRRAGPVIAPVTKPIKLRLADPVVAGAKTTFIAIGAFLGSLAVFAIGVFVLVGVVGLLVIGWRAV